MTDSAKTAVKGPYGIVKLPVDQRTYAGVTFSGDQVIHVIATKLAYPLATHGVLATIAGVSLSTVNGCLNTPYAKDKLQVIAERLPVYAQQLEAAQGEAVQFWSTLLQKGHATLHTGKPADLPLVGYALRASEHVTKATGLLGNDTLTIRHELASMGDLDDPTDMALDAGLATIQKATHEDGEGETPTPPVDA